MFGVKKNRPGISPEAFLKFYVARTVSNPTRGGGFRALQVQPRPGKSL
jgi:hypothetical protein